MTALSHAGDRTKESAAIGRGSGECSTHRIQIRRRRLALIGAVTGVVLLGHDVRAASITFSSPGNITGDSDVFNLGTTTYAFNWNTTAAVNGVTFAGTVATTSVGTMLTISPSSGANSVGAYTSPTGNPFTSLSSGYKTILSDAVYGGAAVVETVNLNGLLPNHLYATQVWFNDPRPKAGRNATITSVGGNSETLQYSVLNVTGSPGQFTIGDFTAASTTQTFTITGSNSTQINALQVRDVTGVWSGAVSGTWDSNSANFTGGNSFTNVAGLVNTVYFGDTDGFGNAVTNSNVTIQSGGVSPGAIVFQNNNVNYTLSSTDSNGISGSASLTKSGSGSLILSGTNSYSGATTLNAGLLQFNAGALPTTTTVTINAAGALNATGAFSNATNWLASGQIAAGSSGAIALTGDDSENINFSGFGSLMLGATSSSNYSGTLTPAGTVYRLGGGGAALTISGTLSGSGNSLVVGTAGASGTVVLASANSYSGGTTVSAGTLSVGAAGTLGSNTSGNNISISAGTNLVLAASGNVGSNQAIAMNSTSSSLSGIGVGYTPASLSALGINATGTGTNGGVFGINYVGTAGIVSLATLDSTLNTSGGTGHRFLGSQTAGTFNGTTLAPASDSVYRLGGGGGSLTLNGTNALTGSASVVIGSPSSNGSGTVILSASENFTGGTTINAGILDVGSRCGVWEQCPAARQTA